jgi:hypothetical protein
VPLALLAAAWAAEASAPDGNFTLRQRLRTDLRGQEDGLFFLVISDRDNAGDDSEGHCGGGSSGEGAMGE